VSSLVKVKFLETRTVQREGGPTFSAGEVYEVSLQSARRWVSRNAAVILPPGTSLQDDDAPPTHLAPPNSADEAEGDQSDVAKTDESTGLDRADGGSDGERTEQQPAPARAPVRSRSSRSRNE
jgi:hypothetical protein